LLRHLGAQELQREVPPGERVLDLVHLGHAALTEALHEAVPLGEDRARPERMSDAFGRRPGRV
jgi:hypothetical protein